MVDILICSMPALFLDRAPGAPALLRSAVETAGYSANTVDLSLEFFTNQCNKNLDTYDRLGCVFRPGEVASAVSLEKAQCWVKDSLNTIAKINPRVIGFSVFTVFQHRSTYLLAQAVREKFPNIKIIVGGFGLQISSNSLSSEPGVKKIELIQPFHQFLSNRKLSDYTVLGSGLDDLINIMEKEIGPSTNTTLYSTDKVIYNTPIPNYNDYKLDQYIWNEAPALPVTGSKGCVRACTFCDVPGQFGKFKYRTGEDIAKEILQLHQRYNVTIFEFTDSLVNGSIKAFRQWLTIIADYNDTQPTDKKIRWFGQYICRPQSQIPADLYDLMKRSGSINLIVGVESGSNKVLESMRKKMSVEDVYAELEKFKEYKLQAQILMLSGFYNETHDDYLDTLKFLVNCQQYVASGVITKIGIGPPLYINDKTYLYEAADELGILVDPYDEYDWVSVADPSNDYVHRCHLRLITQILIDQLGLPIPGNSISNLHTMLERLKKQESVLLEELSGK